MINVANNTIKNYIENLSESEKKELTNFLNIDDETLKPKFETVKENLISKLTLIKESEKDSEVLSKINETIEKVNLEKYNKLNYFRLEDLNNNL
jgi:succinate dehydrogenase flavin-adding protein (antitoxin of CptAB toxin-antitoxin module)